MRRRSATGTLITIDGSPVLQKSNCPSIVALPSAEAEYSTLRKTAKEVSWIRRFSWEVRFKRQFTHNKIIPSIPLLSENTAALSIVRKERLNARTEHIDV